MCLTNLTFLRIGTCNNLLVIERERSLPQISTRTNLQVASGQKDVVAYFVRTMRHYSDKEILVVPFNTGNHWITLAIFIKYD
jgi:hypothetical protein